VDRHDPVPVVGGHPEQQAVADDAGVVDQHGRLTELVRDPLDGGPHAGLVGDVDTDSQGPSPGGLDLLHDRLAAGLVEVEDRDGEAVGGEPLRDAGADATGRTGHDGGARCGGHVGCSCR
jgi:hypothetical protein